MRAALPDGGLGLPKPHTPSWQDMQHPAVLAFAMASAKSAEYECACAALPNGGLGLPKPHTPSWQDTQHLLYPNQPSTLPLLGGSFSSPFVGGGSYSSPFGAAEDMFRYVAPGRLPCLCNSPACAILSSQAHSRSLCQPRSWAALVQQPLLGRWLPEQPFQSCRGRVQVLCFLLVRLSQQTAAALAGYSAGQRLVSSSLWAVAPEAAPSPERGIQVCCPWLHTLALLHTCAPHSTTTCSTQQSCHPQALQAQCFPLRALPCCHSIPV